MLYIVLAAGHVQAAPGTSPRQLPKPDLSAEALAKQIHSYINEERTRHKLSILSWDGALAGIARRHSLDMAQRDYLAHDTPEGRSFVDRYREGAYDCQIPVRNEILLGAENIALGRLYNSVTHIDGVPYFNWNTSQQIARKTVDGWMKSPGHRKNILTPYWKREGIGIEIRPGNKVYITQNFC